MEVTPLKAVLLTIEAVIRIPNKEISAIRQKKNHPNHELISKHGASGNGAAPPMTPRKATDYVGWQSPPSCIFSPVFKIKRGCMQPCLSEGSCINRGTN